MKLKNNLFSFIFFVLVVLLIQSCSPKIIKNVNIKDLERQDTTLPITIYTDTTYIPNNAINIGRLFVGDGGFTTKCDSATIFNLAAVETRKAGGNALHLTKYTKPSIWGSSCHQITGNMLYVPDVIINDTTIVAGLTNSETTSGTNSPPLNVIDIDGVAKNRKYYVASFKVDLGYGRRVAKFADELDNAEKEWAKGLMSGLTWSATANYFFNDAYGMGLSYYQFSASNRGYGYTNTGISGDLETKDNIMFIGPSFVGREIFGKDNDWILSGSVGLGYISYTTKTNIEDYKITTSGFSIGTILALGIDNKIDDNWGIGLEVLYAAGVINKAKVNDNGSVSRRILEAGKGEGLAQISVKAGIRYFINPPKKKT